jgi:sorbose reductase
MATNLNSVLNTLQNVFEQFSMEGKDVAITDASDGIFWVVVQAIAEADGDLVLWYNIINAPILESKAIVKKHSVCAKAYEDEVPNHEAVEVGAKQIIRGFQRLDVFPTKAGMVISRRISKQTIRGYRKQMSVNGKWTLSTANGLATKMLMPHVTCRMS